MARNRSMPKGVNLVPKTLKGVGRVHYGYYGRGAGAVALGRVDSPEFHERLAAAMRRQPKAGTVASLIWAYRQSQDFTGLADRTRRDYLRHLDTIQEQFGHLPLASVSSRHFRKPIHGWRDALAKSSPRQADYAVTVLKLLLGWGQKRGEIEANQAQGISKVYKDNRSDKTWSEDQIQAFMETAPAPLRLAMILARHTGQRQGDLLVLPWTAVKGDSIHLRQRKTGQPMVVPIKPELREALDEARANTASTTILTNSRGLPWARSGNSFRAAWRDATKAAGIAGLVFNDLRGNAISDGFQEGMSREEVAMTISGHSLKNLAMLDVYVDRQKVAEATADRVATRRRGEA